MEVRRRFPHARIVGCVARSYGSVQSASLVPCGARGALIVEGGDAKCVREIEGRRLLCGEQGAVQANGLVDVREGYGILMQFAANVGSVTQSVGQHAIVIRRAREGDGLGVVDGSTGAVAGVAAGLCEASEGLGTLDGLVSLGLRSGFFVEALGLSGLAGFAEVRGVVQKRFELLDHEVTATTVLCR